MKTYRMKTLCLTLAMLIALGCSGIVACGENENVISGEEDSTPGSASLVVTYSIPTGYTVTIPAALNITYPNTTATINVKGTATLQTDKELCVVLDRTNGLVLTKAGSTNTIPYTISYARNQEEIFGIASVPENLGCTVSNCELIGGIQGDWTNRSFNTTIAFNIGSLTGIPAGDFTQTLTFRTWVQDIPQP